MKHCIHGHGWLNIDGSCSACKRQQLESLCPSDATTCSRSYTPESDKLAATLIVPDSIKSFRKYIKRSLKVCRKLEREMHEWKQHAQREADMRMQLMGATSKSNNPAVSG